MRVPTIRLRHVWLVLPALIGAMAMGLLPLRSWDYWWHLVAGQWGSWHDGLLLTNQFLYTMPAEAPGLSQPWLSQKLLYTLHEHVGLSGSLLVRNGFVCAALIALSVELRRQHTTPPMMAVALLGALPIMMATMTLRTHLFVWPLFLILIILMRRIRRAQGSSFWLVVSVPITIGWVQCHGSFLLPCVLILMWIIARLTDLGRRWKTNPKPSTIIGCLLLIGVLALTPLTHPAGLLEVYRYLGEVSSDPVVRGTVSEWMPTTPGRFPVMAPLLYVWLVVGGWFFFQRRRMCDRLDVLMFFGFGVLALVQARGLLWFALVAPLTLTPYLPGSIEDIVEDDEVPIPLQLVHVLLIALLAASAIVTQPGLETRRAIAPLATASPLRIEQPWATLITQDTPVEAVDWLIAHPEHRRLFHDQRWAGFLLWSLLEKDKPSRMVYVDQRIELPGEQIWGLHQSISMARSAWRLQLEAHGVTAILADPITQAPLYKALDRDPEWVKVVPREHYALFVFTPTPEP